MGRGCDPPSERPARWHPEGCPCIDTSTRPAPACHPRATRGPAHNQVSATAGSPPPARWSSFYGHRRKRQAGPERGRPQARKPSACTRHARAPVASLDMPQPRDRCVRKSNTQRVFGERRGPGRTSAQIRRACHARRAWAPAFAGERHGRRGTARSPGTGRPPAAGLGMVGSGRFKAILRCGTATTNRLRRRSIAR